jgi:hypothetical protein
MKEHILWIWISVEEKGYATFGDSIVIFWGTRQCSLLRHYATSRKVAGSIPDKVNEFFNWPNPSSRTMALESTQSLTEMSTGNFPGGKGRTTGA